MHRNGYGERVIDDEICSGASMVLKNIYIQLHEFLKRGFQ
jgi:hypothetical protein